MGTYAVSDLVKEVKVILDRNQETADLVPEDTDTLAQATLVSSIIVDAAKAIESLAPMSMLDATDSSSAQVSWTSNNGAYVGMASVPTSLLRLLSVRVSGWSRPATLITENDGEYALQSNQYVRGNPQRPYAAFVHNGGSRALELYTSNSSSASVTLSYVSEPSVSSSGNISFCSLLKEAILYMAAHLVCVSLGDTDTAAGFKATAYQLANIVEPSQS